MGRRFSSSTARFLRLTCSFAGLISLRSRPGNAPLSGPRVAPHIPAEGVFFVGPPSGANCLQALLLHPPRFTVLASPPTFHSPSAVASHLSGIRLSWDKLLVGFSMSEPVAPIAVQPSAQQNKLLVGFSMSEPVAPIADQPSAQRNKLLVGFSMSEPVAPIAVQPSAQRSKLLVGFSMSEPVAPIADQPSAQRNKLLVGFSTLNRRHFSSFQRALAIPQTPALLAFIWAFRERLVRRNIFWAPFAVI